MSKTRLIALLSGCLFLASCNSYHIQPIEAASGITATLVVYRPHYVSGSNAPVVVSIDGTDVALLKNNNYLEAKVLNGNHRISVRGFRVGLADERDIIFNENGMVLLKVNKPASSVAKAAIPLSMHLSKLYYLEDETLLSVDDIKSRFRRVDIAYK